MQHQRRPVAFDLGLALFAPVLAGLAWMAWAGAPASYLAFNAAALLLAAAAIRWRPVPRAATHQLALAGALVALLWLTAITGTEVDGARRWIGLGPIVLHTGYLSLPLLMVTAAHLSEKWMAALLSAAALACALQPDRATTVALAGAVTVLTLQRRSWPSILALAAALGSGVVVLLKEDLLQPVRFIEGVQLDALARQPILGAVLVAATFAPFALLKRGNLLAGPLVAFMVIASLAAFAGPYPSILIGYGAAPIVGFGLAISALRPQ